MEFDITLRIIATTESELLDAFDYFVANHAQKIVSASTIGETLTQEVTLVEDGPTNTKNTLLSLKSHFGALLGNRYTITPRIGASP